MLNQLILNYDEGRYDFSTCVRNHLGVADLSRLHGMYDYPLLVRETDQTTALHRELYDIGESFLCLYRKFLSGFVQSLFDCPLVVQRIPNFRFQLPNNVGVGRFHRDRENGHQATEINFWVPLTPVNPDNTVWVERRAESGDFKPCLLGVGQLLVFDGANLQHGNKVNRSDRTRLSFDFRVIPRDLYEASDAVSLNTGSRFALGGYFESLPSDDVTVGSEPRDRRRT